MENKGFRRQLENRTKEFELSIIELSTYFPDTPEGRTIKCLVVKSGKSVSANYRAANKSQSKYNVKNKLEICEREAGEIAYWLDIIADGNLIDSELVKPALKEANEILEIFSSLNNTSTV